uniref:Uncharacterized protein n=1 Tax=Utricularia reniformis TaxID=192314 RepID=A0A1Y0B1R2_9LAMI|nr:hypothetical protein AEK19_MT1067 [Utricularia reniformis]ART31289.1 hypothetical protein AEK19_MT1067 [Utricularia reniformis]
MKGNRKGRSKSLESRLEDRTCTGFLAGLWVVALFRMFFPLAFPFPSYPVLSYCLVVALIEFCHGSVWSSSRHRMPQGNPESGPRNWISSDFS